MARWAQSLQQLLHNRAYANALRSPPASTMSTVGDAAAQALGLVATADPKLFGIVLLSLEISLAAVVFGCIIGLPLGAAIAVNDFRGRRAVIVTLNALMGLPSVVVGLVVYLLLSRAGPLGAWGILFTPTAMVIAQTILITPTIAALSRQIVADGWAGISRAADVRWARRSSAPRSRSCGTLRFSLVTIVARGLRARGLRSGGGDDRRRQHRRRDPRDDDDDRAGDEQGRSPAGAGARHHPAALSCSR